MTSGHRGFYALCSIKGGVGKSTLAVVTATLLAECGRVPVLVDADLTGTSLADGLALCAPKVKLQADGAMDLDAAPTGERWTVEETRHLRNRRKGIGGYAPPPYLNDALFHKPPDDEHDTRVDAILWTHERTDGVLYLPSSPLRRDVEASTGWLHGNEPFRWILRLAWVIDALLMQRSDVTDIIVDLPPGVLGFTHETLALAGALANREQPFPEGYPRWHDADLPWKSRALLITTPDRNDLVPALEYVAETAVHLPALSLVPLVNKVSGHSLSDVRREAQKHIDPVLRPLELEKRLQSIDDLRTSLGRLFREGGLDIDDDVRKLAGRLLAEGT